MFRPSSWLALLALWPLLGQATPPALSGITAGNSDNTSAAAIDVVMPATIAADALIVALVCLDSHNQTVTVANGFALLSTQALSRNVALWKKAVGNEDGTTISVGTSTAAVSANVAFLVTGAADPAVEPPQSSGKTDDSGASVSPDGASFDSSFDGRDIRWVTWACVDDDPLTSAYPYADNNTRYTYTTANSITNTFASKGDTADDGTENPGAFTMNASHFWSVRTLAFVAPATAAGPIFRHRRTKR